MSFLFQPIEIGTAKIRNRVFVAPMCQYSSQGNDGHPTDWHLVHLGTRAVGGAGLVMFEATAVNPVGRISPQDLGIWSDDHIDSFSRIVKFIKGQGSSPAIQLAHAGRKASHESPWLGGDMLMPDVGGWEIDGPSAIAYDDSWSVPNELTLEGIDGIIEDFVSAAQRSISAGFEVIELHLAHGYLACEFMSPLSNSRTDRYGGSLNDRCRFAVDIASAVRNVIPEGMPLIARISATEYMQDGWNLNDSIELSGWLKDVGVDMIDCASGGNAAKQELDPYPGYQVPFAKRIKDEVGILTGAVGLLTDPYQCEQTLRSGDADVILLGRELLRNPYWALSAQVTLDNEDSVWPNQYVRAR